MNPELVTTKPSSRKYVLTEKGLDLLSKELADGKSYFYLSKEFDINPDTLSALAKENNIHKDNRRKYVLNENYFENIDTKEKAYWLGFLAADGYVDAEKGVIFLGLQPKDKDHIRKFLNAVGSNKKIKEKHSFFNNKDHLGCYAEINSKKMAKDLFFLGLYAGKSLTYTPPTPEQVSRSFIKYWILGYFDGDGGLTLFRDPKGKSIRYNMSFVGTRKTIEFIQEYLGSNKKIKLAHNCKNTYEIKFTETDTTAILNYLYSDFDTSKCLERKYKKYLEILKINASKPKRKKKQQCLIPY